MDGKLKDRRDEGDFMIISIKIDEKKEIERRRNILSKMFDSVKVDKEDIFWKKIGKMCWMRREEGSVDKKKRMRKRGKVL